MGSYKSLKFYVTSSRSINIANTKLLTNGYIRVYLKVAGKAVSKKVTLTIGGKKITKKAHEIRQEFGLTLALFHGIPF